MGNLRHEEAALIDADRHIADGNKRIDRLTQLLEREKQAGIDTANCENLISTMQGILTTFHEHRRLIVQEIARQQLLIGQLVPQSTRLDGD